MSQIIYPPQISVAPELSQTSDRQCILGDISFLNIDGNQRSTYSVEERDRRSNIKNVFIPRSRKEMETLLLNKFFLRPEDGGYFFLKTKDLNAQWICFEGNQEERLEYRKFIEETASRAYSKELLRERYEFNQLTVKYLNPNIQNINEIADGLFHNLTIHGGLSKSEYNQKYSKNIFVLEFDDTNFSQLAVQDVTQSKF